MLAAVCQLYSMDSMGSDLEMVLHACFIQFADSAAWTVWSMVPGPNRVLHACLLQFAGSAAWTVSGLILIGSCMLALYSFAVLQRGQYGV